MSTCHSCLYAGSGLWLEDFAGQRYLDAVSSWWVTSLGTRTRASTPPSSPSWKLEHVILAGFTHEPVIALSEPGQGGASGSHALLLRGQRLLGVEVAAKMSFHYWRNTGPHGQTAFHHTCEQLSRRDPGRPCLGRRRALQGDLSALLMDVRVVGSPDCFARVPGETWVEHSIERFALMEEALARHHEERRP